MIVPKFHGQGCVVVGGAVPFVVSIAAAPFDRVIPRFVSHRREAADDGEDLQVSRIRLREAQCLRLIR